MPQHEILADAVQELGPWFRAFAKKRESNDDDIYCAGESGRVDIPVVLRSSIEGTAQVVHVVLVQERLEDGKRCAYGTKRALNGVEGSKPIASSGDWGTQKYIKL